MRVKWVGFCRWLLGVFGISATISSCNALEDIIDNNMSVEYGMPHMTYSIKGKVVDNQNGKSISGIEVAFDNYSFDKDTTDNNGVFSLNGEAWPSEKITLRLHDIDPESDGNYKDTEAEVQLKQIKKGSGSWNKGTYEAKDVVLKIERQENK